MIKTDFNEGVVWDFRNSYCFLLSKMVQKKTSWNINVVYDGNIPVHAVNSTPIGGLIDIKGFYPSNGKLLEDLNRRGQRIEEVLETETDWLRNYDNIEMEYGRENADKLIGWFKSEVRDKSLKEISV